MAKIAALMTGGGVSFDDIGQGITNGSAQASSSSGNITGFTVGKTYLIIYDRNNTSNGGVSSGADVLGMYIYLRASNYRVNVMLLKATATTITFVGNNNPTFIAQLD